ncbi:MAG: hypothetical protein IJ860_07860 [Eubacterium sp.]|nr:hypothetical protein [Eubacterium sp.]
MRNDKKQLCVKCAYSGTIGSGAGKSGADRANYTFCDYLCITKSMRPCPAEDCTVYKPRRRKRKALTPWSHYQAE